MQVIRGVRPFERLAIERFDLSEPIRPPPIFIVGAPRSGSTILYQVLANTFDVTYASNFLRLFTYAPVVGSAVEHALFRGSAFNRFNSRFGRTQGFRGPSEMGPLWYRWFPRDRHFVARGTIPESYLASLRRTVTGITRVTKRAFLVKNLNCGQRIQVLSEALPEALWVYCTRDPVLTAASLLRARHEEGRDPAKWWSVMPREVDSLRGLSPLQQVVRQVCYLEDQIEADLAAFVPEEGRLRIDYASLCVDAGLVTKVFQEFCIRNGYAVERREGAVMPVIEARSLSDEELWPIRREMADVRATRDRDAAEVATPSE